MHSTDEQMFYEIRVCMIIKFVFLNLQENCTGSNPILKPCITVCCGSLALARNVEPILKSLGIMRTEKALIGTYCRKVDPNTKPMDCDGKLACCLVVASHISTGCDEIIINDFFHQ